MPIERHRLWVNYYHRLFPNSKLVLVHDGANPGCWNDPQAQVDYLEPHLGRPTFYDHAGCFRSLFHMKAYFDQAKKVAWLDWDFYIARRKFMNWVLQLDSGWNTVWCKTFGFPEASCQIVCSDQFQRFRDFEPYWSVQPHSTPIETHIPFTQVARHFIGGRYTDVRQNPPSNAHYVAQASLIQAQNLLNQLPLKS